MKLNVVGAALLGLGLVAAAGSQAATVTLTGWAYGTGNSVQATTTASSLASYAGLAGGFGGSLSGAGALDRANFITYCIELEESFSFGSSGMTGYSVEAASSYFQARAVANPLRPSGQQVAERLAKLITWVNADATRVDTAAESTALQLAVWNIVYDSDWTVTAVSNFRDTSGYKTLATQMLQGAQNTAARYDVFALQRAGSQDFIAASLRVPEPASGALAALALAALAVSRRKVSAAA